MIGLPSPTRAAALQRLDDFLPHAGPDYARGRNHDLGPGQRDNVSLLGPHIRHRLITEAEVASAALARHGPVTAEKFLQEVCWRTYWKGWLELRPGVWQAYLRDRDQALASLDADARQRAAFEAAVAGQTGLECLDAWSRELVETGYLHNHARMWFASIWIFTLRLPWTLGADFFYRSLLDGDPASNTLSWRWVAGLQTPGKTYLARAENIERYTGGRLRPAAVALAAEAIPIVEGPLPAPRRLSAAADIQLDRPTGLLLCEEDLAPESLSLDASWLRAVAAVDALDDRSPLEVSGPARMFTFGAIEDALARAGKWLDAPAERLESGTSWDAAVLDWARRSAIDQVVMPEVPVGPARARLDRLRATLEPAGIRLLVSRRAWDQALWPRAARGFFAFWNDVSGELARLAAYATTAARAAR